MAIKQLTEAQVREMTVEEKDRWWLENVFQGNVPQFTFRAVTCGFLLGGVLSITNLYIGAKTGWASGRRHHFGDSRLPDLQGAVRPPPGW
jgi:hypothetical protein